MDIDKLIAEIENAGGDNPGCLSERDARRVCEAMKEVLIEESNV